MISLPGRVAICGALWGPVLLQVDCAIRGFLFPFDARGPARLCDLVRPPQDLADGGGLLTPAQIVPEWYVLPWYGVLRAVTQPLGPIDAKMLGLIAFYAALFAPLIVAFFEWSRLPRAAGAALAVAALMLVAAGALAALPPAPVRHVALQGAVVIYFAALLIAFPALAIWGRK